MTRNSVFLFDQLQFVWDDLNKKTFIFNQNNASSHKTLFAKVALNWLVL